MATVEDVEATLRHLVTRLDDLDPAFKAMLPSRRMLQAECPDLDLAFHSEWRNGSMGEIHEGRTRRPDIRLSAGSDDLLALANGDVTFAQAYSSNRIRVHASVTDLLRLRAAL